MNIIINYVISNVSHNSKINPNIYGKNKLELIVKNIPEKNNFMHKLLYTKIDSDIVFDEVINDLINKINTENKNLLELKFVIFKLFLTNNKFKIFSEILDIIYCQSNINYIKMISILKPELLDINLN